MPRLTRVQPATRDLGWIDIVVPALLEAIGGSRFRRQASHKGDRCVGFLVWSLWAVAAMGGDHQESSGDVGGGHQFTSLDHLQDCGRLLFN
jgi:hypothetical protein